MQRWRTFVHDNMSMLKREYLLWCLMILLFVAMPTVFYIDRLCAVNQSSSCEFFNSYRLHFEYIWFIKYAISKQMVSYVNRHSDNCRIKF